MVQFVESSGLAVKTIRQNLESLGIEGGFEVLQQDVVRYLSKAGGPADFVFLDPPYRMQPAYQQTMESLAVSGLLAPSGLVIAEHEKRYDPGAQFGTLSRYRKLEQGDAALSFYRRTEMK